MANCDVTSWANNSRSHYGIPNQFFVKPLVLLNKQMTEAPQGFQIQKCFLNVGELYQSGLSVATSAVAAFTSPTELYVPAGNVVGGERIEADFAISAPVTAASTDTVTVAVRIADDAGAARAGTTTTLVTVAVPTSGSARVASARVRFYYDATDQKLHGIVQTRSDSTYATTVIAPIAFNPALVNRIQLGITQSDVSHSEVITFTHGTIGKVL